jgi:hypothetical protein
MSADPAAALHIPHAPLPWYREPWPWLLLCGPAAAIVAGVITMVIAFTSFDGVVADDYYRQGLGINRVLEREASASARALSAQVLFNPSGDRVRVTLDGAVEAGTSLRLRLVRAARAGADQEIALAPIGAGLYEGSLAQPLPGRWHLQLEDSDRRWRIAGTARLPADKVIGLAATPTGAPTPAPTVAPSATPGNAPG